VHKIFERLQGMDEKANDLLQSPYVGLQEEHQLQDLQDISEEFKLFSQYD
jgi:hypothetical protein